MEPHNISEIVCENAQFEDSLTHNLCAYTLPIDCVAIVEAFVLGKDEYNRPVASKQIVTISNTILGIADILLVTDLSTYIEPSNAGSTCNVIVTDGIVEIEIKGPDLDKPMCWQCQMKIYIC